MTNRVRTGFTLLEAVITLAVVCSMAFISIYGIKDYQKRIEEKQAIAWFKNTFKDAMNYRFLANQIAQLLIDDPKNELTFSYAKKNQKPTDVTSHRKMRMPKYLHLTGNHADVYYIEPNGHNDSVHFAFYSDLTHRTYDFKILMGWGEIIEHQT